MYLIFIIKPELITTDNEFVNKLIKMLEIFKLIDINDAIFENFDK